MAIDEETPKNPVLEFNSLLSKKYSMQNSKPTEDVSMMVEGEAITPTTSGANQEQESSKSAGAAVVTGKRVRIVKKSSTNSSNSNNSSSTSFPTPEIPKVRYSDLGGIEGVLQDIKDLIERPFKSVTIYKHLGVDPPRGVLLHGAPGSGKSTLAMAIAGELGIPLLMISAPELVSGMSGESEGRIRDLFEQAKGAAPCLLFIDEIDAITPKRETAQREMERRMVAQLLTCMDDLGRMTSSSSGSNSEDAVDKKEEEQVNVNINKLVMVLGATNRPDSLDPALRRAGRFDREIQLGIPTEEGRQKILNVLCQKLRLKKEESSFTFLTEIARNTPGYVGADLKALTQEAARNAIKRIEDYNISLDNEEAAIGKDDFMAAMKKIQPSAKREGFAVVPDTKWQDIGALEYVRDELRMAVVEPIRHADKFAAVGITAPAGVLLWGPPGCGKTLLAKAVANESHSNFISVKGPELLNKYVGESERAIRQVFERARQSAPCVIFFDELDALCPRRSDENNDTPSSRVVNQLLTEMDGLEGRRNVFILAATNRPDIIDPAMTRPGRLDKLLYVNLPTPTERVEILRTVGGRTPWSPDVNLSLIAHDPRCANFSGADLAALVKEAALAAVKESIENSMMDDEPMQQQQLVVTSKHIEAAFSRVLPSVSAADLAAYERMNTQRMRK